MTAGWRPGGCCTRSRPRSVSRYCSGAGGRSDAGRRRAGGRAPVLLHLLAPNMRQQQVTRDLASFWRNTYPQVRKELKGRYPKHPWPDDPLTAPATALTKNRLQSGKG